MNKQLIPMKKTFVYLTILGLLSTSCSLDKKPYDALTGDDLANNEEGPELVTQGNYFRLKDWSDNLHRLTEYPGDNVSLSGTTSDDFMKSYDYRRVATNYRADYVWEKSYQTILGANKVLAEVAEGESTDRDQLIAENLYLRGLMYFYLTNIFGRPYNQGTGNLSVPLKLSTETNDNPARSTVGQVYEQIEKDLLRAEKLFTKTKSNVYASREATQALLAKMYLFQEKNELAKEYADKVINSGRFSLLPTMELSSYPVKKPEDNKETIFAVKYVKDLDYPYGGAYSIGAMYVTTVNGQGWGELYPSRPYLEMIREYPSDVRNSFIQPVVSDSKVLSAYYVNKDYNYRNVTVVKNGTDYTYTEGKETKKLEKVSNGAGEYLYYIHIEGEKRRALIDNKLAERDGFPKYFILKCSGQEGQDLLWSPVILRLADVYLMRAEANAKLGNNQVALDDVNTIRRRAGIPEAGLFTLNSLKGKTILQIVMDERQLELAWEGHRKFDIFRNGLTLDRKYPGSHLLGNAPVTQVPANSPAVIEFIPEPQITKSGGVLTQNP